MLLLLLLLLLLTVVAIAIGTVTVVATAAIAFVDDIDNATAVTALDNAFFTFSFRFPHQLPDDPLRLCRPLLLRPPLLLHPPLQLGHRSDATLEGLDVSVKQVQHAHHLGESARPPGEVIVVRQNVHILSLKGNFFLHLAAALPSAPPPPC